MFKLFCFVYSDLLSTLGIQLILSTSCTCLLHNLKLPCHVMTTMLCPPLPWPGLAWLPCLSNMHHYDPFREERIDDPSYFPYRSRRGGGYFCRQRGGLQLHKIQSYGQVTSLFLSDIMPCSPILFCDTSLFRPIMSAHASMYCTILYCTRWAANRDKEGLVYCLCIITGKIIKWLCIIYTLHCTRTQASDAGHHQPAVRRLRWAQVTSWSEGGGMLTVGG